MASASSLTFGARSTGWNGAISLAASSCRRRYSAAGVGRESRRHRVTVVCDAGAQSAAAAVDVRSGATLSCFSCPICGGAMIRASNCTEEGPTTLRCDAKHSFDVSRDGVVNLLAKRGGGSRRVATGDSPQMLQARRRFLGAGHYVDASNRVNEEVLKCIADVSRIAAASATIASAASTSASDDTPDPAETANQDDGHFVDEEEKVTKEEKKLSPRQRRLAANKRKSQSAKAQARVDRTREEERRRVEEGLIGDVDPSTLDPLVVDFGCGEGWWLEQVVKASVSDSAADDTTTAAATIPTPRFAAFDASTAAARRSTAEIMFCAPGSRGRTVRQDRAAHARTPTPTK